MFGNSSKQEKLKVNKIKFSYSNKISKAINNS